MENNLSRNKQHELNTICIYDALTYVYSGQEFSVEEIMSSIFEKEYVEIPSFDKEVVIKSLTHLDEIISIFQEKMPKMSFDRLNLLERSILIMSYTNCKFVGGVDKRVVIDTAIKLSKKYLGTDYSGKDDYKFVNAILDNVL